ncbi:hypothetical protein SARC_06447 [Sphaeroforma arctica JP610]|uniref:Uncharacterized protein n=1 Tax=Sphaeroforma arctica JP610 TaxID=667725 RepID=A0A0L0FX56_9EUKA|nr:hypothetical protein SARC_06447 [Sphaeroforma arctica JP610]KNC81219.1 hypothetical protein SARC_06447 [Sphaeroforma arctica JP610]|eukprot:XP_014155121.1 hypothetical protein SARC_06447 [Sphaeroforma arctica JP610]
MASSIPSAVVPPMSYPSPQTDGPHAPPLPDYCPPGYDSVAPPTQQYQNMYSSTPTLHSRQPEAQPLMSQTSYKHGEGYSASRPQSSLAEYDHTRPTYGTHGAVCGEQDVDVHTAMAQAKQDQPVRQGFCKWFCFGFLCACCATYDTCEEHPCCCLGLLCCTLVGCRD